MRTLIIIAAVGSSIALSGCATMTQTASVAGDHKVMQGLDPGFAVRGKRLKDSQWIGRMQETGIKVFGWKRPKQ